MKHAVAMREKRNTFREFLNRILGFFLDTVLRFSEIQDLKRPLIFYSVFRLSTADSTIKNLNCRILAIKNRATTCEDFFGVEFSQVEITGLW